MKKWTETPACSSKIHCNSCRNIESFRESLFKNKMVDQIDFLCPINLKINKEIPKIHLEKANLMTKGIRLLKEIKEAKKNGFKISSRKLSNERKQICKGCDFYNPKGNWYLGECQAPGCGCTRLKTWIETAHCPLNPPKW